MYPFRIVELGRVGRGPKGPVTCDHVSAEKLYIPREKYGHRGSRDGKNPEGILLKKTPFSIT